MQISGTIGQRSSASSSSSHSHRHHQHRHHNSRPPTVVLPIPIPVAAGPGVVITPGPATHIIGTVGQTTGRTVVITQSQTQIRQSRRHCWGVFVTMLAFVFFLVTVPLPFSESVEVLAFDRKAVVLDGNWLNSVSLDLGANANVDAFLFDAKPIPSETVVLPTLSVSPVISAGSFHAVRYDLYEGSVLYAEWLFSSTRYGPSLLFLRGSEAFEMFKSGNLQDVPYADKLHEKYHITKGEFTLRTNSRSEYYCIFYMAEPGTASGSATFQVTAKTLSLTNPPPVASSVVDCASSTTTCTLSLASNGGYSHKSEYHLVLAPRSGVEFGDAFSVRIQKHGRIAKYIGAIARTVMFVIVFGGFLSPIFTFFAMIFASSVGAIGAAAVLGAGWLCGCFKSRNGSNGGANNSGYQPVPFGESDVEAGGSHQQVYPADAPPAYSVVIDHEASVAIESKDDAKKQLNEIHANNEGSSSS